MTQYCINKEDVSREVDKRIGTELEKDRVQVLFDTIGKLALREWHNRQSYTCDYGEIVNNLYVSIDFVDMLESIMDTSGYGEMNSVEASREAVENASEFVNAFQFFTDYERDGVDIHRYKRYMPDKVSYPVSIYEMLLKRKDVSIYTHSKFCMLEQRMAKSCSHLTE